MEFAIAQMTMSIPIFLTLELQFHFKLFVMVYTHLAPRIIEGQSETDETNCEQWLLIHIYNRCNGSNEINCDPSPSLNCSTNHHVCVSPKTNKLICLPIEKANDGTIDCLSAAAEPTLCPNDSDLSCPRTFHSYQSHTFLPCTAIHQICDNRKDCDNNEDEQTCRIYDLSEVLPYKGVCTENYESDGFDVAKILCKRFSYSFFEQKLSFTFDQ
jgi:hypothetical protein